MAVILSVLIVWYKVISACYVNFSSFLYPRQSGAWPFRNIVFSQPFSVCLKESHFLSSHLFSIPRTVSGSRFTKVSGEGRKILIICIFSHPKFAVWRIY